ncbi:Cloroperoxidase [Coprinopsis marcescibilis]|uniref:Cloroperoxidase n=1 Tax=Coprinopsis marcescibilis TaxID=230819 RepID=A0A5C3KEF0_COPMA|nr:Cloroperoxidase [Coprinopsis marcescibilis]
MVQIFSSKKTLACAIVALSVTPALAFPASYSSLGGLSDLELRELMPKLKPVIPPAPPGPLAFTGAKLVDDKKHPWQRQGKDDIRGTCPGLNTLASHGYLPRDGVATPEQIIKAVQEGFNMENRLARFTTYAAHLLDGNPITDLLSIGQKTRRTGPDPPSPAIVGGISNHGTFEGDASMTRGDAFDGDNHSFNQTLFDQFKDFSDRFGGGFYNLTVAAELRFQRIQQSIATNPEFSLFGLRHLTAYAEATFPATFFVDGRRTAPGEAGHLDMTSAESFFKGMRYPKGFFRPAAPVGTENVPAIFTAHPVQPGKNVGGVNTFTVDESLGSILDGCTFYTQFVNTTIRGLYPNPTGVLRRNLNLNLKFFYESSGAGEECPQVFPYGRD